MRVEGAATSAHAFNIHRDIARSTCVPQALTPKCQHQRGHHPDLTCASELLTFDNASFTQLGAVAALATVVGAPVDVPASAGTAFAFPQMMHASRAWPLPLR
jgi:hypothetical protein